MREHKKSSVSVPYENLLMKRLKSPKACIGYLNTVLEEGNEESFLIALHDVAQAQVGIAKVARLAKMHRESVHRMLSKRGNPRINNLFVILHALGLNSFSKTSDLVSTRVYWSTSLQRKRPDFACTFSTS